MALDDDIRIMQQVGLFEGLTGEQLRLLAFGSESVKLAAGEQVFQEGDEADCAYLVAIGEIDLVKERNGKRVVVKTASRGAILGELALIAQTKRLTDAVARRDSELLVLNRSLFRRMLTEYPEVAAKLHARISANLSAMIDSIGKLAPHFSS